MSLLRPTDQGRARRGRLHEDGVLDWVRRDGGDLSPQRTYADLVRGALASRRAWASPDAEPACDRHGG
ncbi:MAG: hypothetical protein H6723_17750 [Sandaracinus sp.]|nr:hypothetical protein [Sandaracinus sp.]